MNPTGERCVYVTVNTEYHVLAGRCVGVRDRCSGQWLAEHRALRQGLRGGVRFEVGGLPSHVHTPPSVGDSLLFRAQGRDIVTSCVISVRHARAA